MLWYFILHNLVIAVLGLKHFMAATNLEITAQQFFMLGLIPGTNFQITFTDIIILFWTIVFYRVTTKLYLKAQLIILKINLRRYWPLVWRHL